jgi:hypothetical protein
MLRRANFLKTSGVLSDRSSVMLLNCSILKKPPYSFETSAAFYESTQRNIAEGLVLQQHRSEHLTSCTAGLHFYLQKLVLTDGQTEEAWGHTENLMLFRKSGSIEKGECFSCINFQRVVNVNVIGICG